MNTHEIFSTTPNQIKTARLRRSTQPDSGSNERGHATGKDGVKLNWAADIGYLQWQSDNHLFVVGTKGNKNQRIEIDLSAKSPAADTIKAGVTQAVAVIQQQPYRDIIGNLGEAIVAFQARPAAATGMGTHILPANIPMTGALVSRTL